MTRDPSCSSCGRTLAVVTPWLFSCTIRSHGRALGASTRAGWGRWFVGGAGGEGRAHAGSGRRWIDTARARDMFLTPGYSAQVPRFAHTRLGGASPLSSSATTSTVERALPSSAVQVRCWSLPGPRPGCPWSATRPRARPGPATRPWHRAGPADATSRLDLPSPDRPIGLMTHQPDTQVPLFVRLVVVASAATAAKLRQRPR
jgi:hypothetical protein